MNEICIELQKLRNDIPTYHDSNISDLDKIYRRYREIMLHYGSEHETATYELRINSVTIDNMIHYCRNENKKKNKQDWFERAATELNLDIDSLMQMMGCSK